MGSTLAQTIDGFLADAAHLDHLRPHTLRTIAEPTRSEDYSA